MDESVFLHLPKLRGLLRLLLRAREIQADESAGEDGGGCSDGGGVGGGEKTAED